MMESRNSSDHMILELEMNYDSKIKDIKVILSD